MSRKHVTPEGLGKLVEGGWKIREVVSVKNEVRYNLVKNGKVVTRTIKVNKPKEA